MKTMNQPFGSFRSLLQHDTQTTTQQQALSALIKNALAQDTALFKQQWLPYLRKSPACTQHHQTMDSLRALLLRQGPLQVTIHNHHEHLAVNTINFSFRGQDDLPSEAQALREIVEKILGYVTPPLRDHIANHRSHLLALGQLWPDESGGVLLSYIDASWETQQQHHTYSKAQFSTQDEILALYPHDIWSIDIEEDASHYHVCAHTLIDSNVPIDEIGDHIISDILKHLKRAMTRDDVITYDVATVLLLRQFSREAGMDDYTMSPIG